MINRSSENPESWSVDEWSAMDRLVREKALHGLCEWREKGFKAIEEGKVLGNKLWQGELF
jgi:hypothetical protein